MRPDGPQTARCRMVKEKTRELEHEARKKTIEAEKFCLRLFLPNTTNPTPEGCSYEHPLVEPQLMQR